MHKVNFLIIGAGPTGLGAAYRLKELGINDLLILEKEDHVGGLASSFCDNQGFFWDIGGHVQFSHYPYFDRVMDRAIPQNGWLHHQRESWVWIYDRFVPYPFQNNIRFLPRDKMWRCLKDLIPNGEIRRSKPANFKEWILASFGSALADEFMLPYNFKVWAFPPEQMNYQWIGERVATVDFTRILENVVYEKMDASWGPNNTFRFPLVGGTGSIWENVANLIGRASICLNSTVARVSSTKRIVTLTSGEQIHYEKLLNTMPLDQFTKIVDGIVSKIRSQASRLKHSTSHIVGIGIKGTARSDLNTKCWMYFPESSTPFYRVTVFSNYSPLNVPGPKFYSLMCEISESTYKPVKRESLVEETIAGLERIGFIDDRQQVVSRWSYSAEYGYPTPSLERDDILSEIIPYLDRLDIYSRGRFGGWKYEVSNQDHSFMQGVEWVDKVVNSREESTYRVDLRLDPNMSIKKPYSNGAILDLERKHRSQEVRVS